jgi:glucosyl-3-phosphoglycerate synthase
MTTTDAHPAPLRRFHHRDFDVEQLLAAKGASVVSVCLPARNEASTVGAIVATVHGELVERGLVDEVLVVDDHSTDGTAEVAAAEGAKVVDAASTLPEFGSGHGKGEVLWASLYAAEGDLIVWCDSDVVGFGAHFVTGLLGPLLCEPGVDFVKGHYRRPERDREGGGRVTELVARPALSLCFPELAALQQPLSGEYAGRRSVLEQLPFVGGYGVDVGLLIDLARTQGTERIVQVDLDTRLHRNRPLAELGPQAAAILHTVLRRVDPDLLPTSATLVGADGSSREFEFSERPPMVDVPAYRRRHPPGPSAG